MERHRKFKSSDSDADSINFSFSFKVSKLAVFTSQSACYILNQTQSCLYVVSFIMYLDFELIRPDHSLATKAYYSA